MLKNLNNKYIKISIIFFIIIYFYTILDFNTLLNELKLFNEFYFFLSILLFFPNTCLLIYKWFLLTKKFIKFKFYDLYKKFSFAFFISDITHNSLLVEAAKFISLKKINYLEKTSLIINDKIIVVTTKVIFFFFFLLLLNENKNIELILNFFNKEKIYLLFIILSVVILITFSKFKRYFLKYYNKYFSSQIIERRKIFFIEIIRCILISCIYFLSFLQFTSFENAVFFALISPLIEILIRLQFITTVGFRELILFFIGYQLGLDQSVILSSLFVTFVTLSSSILNLLLSLLIKEKLRVDKFNDNQINFIFTDKKERGNNDFYAAVKLISKYNKFIRLNSVLNLNYKKIIIQENFLSPIYFIRLIIFCIFYRGKLLILLTEFFTKTKNSMSFNNFNSEYTPNNLFLLFLLILYYKTTFLLGFRSEKLSNLYYRAYHKLRYTSTVFFSKYAYGFLIAHPKIKVPFKNKMIIQFPYIFPTIKYNRKWQSKNCKFLLDFSGQLTNYRIKNLKNLKFNGKIFNFDQLKNFYKLNTNFFINSKTSNSNKKIYFAYHLQKNEKWKYSSPTRYFNSLKNNKIPVANKNFNDIYSKVFLTKKIFIEKSKKKILKKIKILNQTICQFNIQSKKNVCNLVNF
jgi:hypothetical protein